MKFNKAKHYGLLTSGNTGSAYWKDDDVPAWYELTVVSVHPGGVVLEMEGIEDVYAFSDKSWPSSVIMDGEKMCPHCNKPV